MWAKKVGTEVPVMGEEGRGHWFGFAARKWDKMKRSKALLKSPTFGALRCVVYMEWRAELTFFVVRYFLKLTTGAHLP